MKHAIVVIVYCIFVLSACGQKGALFLPESATEQQKRESGFLLYGNPSRQAKDNTTDEDRIDLP